MPTSADDSKSMGSGVPGAAATPAGRIDQLITRRGLLRAGGAVAAALSASSLLDACGGASASSSASQTHNSAGGGKPIDELHWILTSEPINLDPALGVDGGSLQIIGNVVDTLFAFDATTNVLVPKLATGARYADPRTLVISVRRGVRFHDGSPLTADDVAYSLNRYRAKAIGSYFNIYYGNVASIQPTRAT